MQLMLPHEPLLVKIMSTPDEAQAAIRGLNGQAIDRRAVVVNEARPKESSGGFGGGGQRRDAGAGGGYRGGRRGY